MTAIPSLPSGFPSFRGVEASDAVEVSLNTEPRQHPPPWGHLLLFFLALSLSLSLYLFLFSLSLSLSLALVFWGFFFCVSFVVVVGS
jgi:hypothetical protein